MMKLYSGVQKRYHPAETREAVKANQTRIKTYNQCTPRYIAEWAAGFCDECRSFMSAKFKSRAAYHAFPPQICLYGQTCFVLIKNLCLGWEWLLAKVAKIEFMGMSLRLCHPQIGRDFQPFQCDSYGHVFSFFFLTTLTSNENSSGLRGLYIFLHYLLLWEFNYSLDWWVFIRRPLKVQPNKHPFGTRTPILNFQF